VYAVAYLHDIGRSINDDDHAKQSRKIVWNELSGFTEEEKSIIANTVRYHGGKKLPKSKKDTPYSTLSSLNKKKVKELVALLKLGDGLGKGPDKIISDLKFIDNTQTFLIKNTGDVSKVLKTLRKRVIGVNKILGTNIKFKLI
jgi:exopolyphosphatase/pppGpp-phosphohydrolase